MARNKLKQPSSAYTPHNKIKLVRAGSEYFTLLISIINNAKHTLHLQVYIFDYDDTGKQVADALLAAVKRNVQVFLLADAYASHALPGHFVKQLTDGGINFRFFQPFFKSKYFYIGRRMHHKLIVADAAHCMIGGINIGDRYNDMPEQKAWLDFALYAEGDIAREVCLLAVQMWSGFFKKKGRTANCDAAQIPFTLKQHSYSPVRLRRNDWVRSKSDITATYREIFATSATQITILCSYFMPGIVLKKSILRAVRRGVRIRVIMAGASDIGLAKNAERFMYDWLLRNKVEIYEYQPNILHGKLAVCDNKWVTIGSYNLNNISAYASVELNMDVNDAHFAVQTEKILEEIIANDCLAITKQQLSHATNILKRLARWCSYNIVRLLFFLFTFYFKQRKW